jgi:hypothetical protein
VRRQSPQLRRYHLFDYQPAGHYNNQYKREHDHGQHDDDAASADDDNRGNHHYHDDPCPHDGRVGPDSC